jgi:dihydrofolate synthase/folylpolyglutamate synthase
VTYKETLDYLYYTLPMFSRIGAAAYKKDLDNTIALCSFLGNPQNTFKSIHVAGTNGKGSVSHMLASVFQTAGYTTGLYTSPHLYDFRERIRIDGQLAEEDFVVDFVERIRPAIDQLQPSFFEITVAMAFDYFARKKVDIAIVEVGMGGRLDSTNVILPELSVITNIGWDHMNILGDSLELIAREKAGIIKPKVPVVVGETIPETRPVFEATARQLEAPIYFAEERFTIESFELENQQITIEVNDSVPEEDFPLDGTYTLDLPGLYQTANIRTVLQSVSLLSSWFPDQSIIKKALANTRAITGLGGRWEVIREHPTVVLEVAHNVQGLNRMLDHLEQLDYAQLRIVFGIVKDKDYHSVLKLLPANARYYFTQAHIPRALEAGELQQLAADCNLFGESFEDVNTAIKKAISDSDKNDMIVVCGSIFLVAEADRSLVAQFAQF